ncbi:hypothetical protein FOA52_012833 [Chlamydomonas sp. UWO 241]|nr:hypothetical protein FOA52_012833 [Chlamydomonas sp. UWO 241]
MEPQPNGVQQAHMTRVVERLFQTHGWDEDEDEDVEDLKPVGLFDSDQPDDKRGECARLLLEHGARGFNNNSPVMWRILREYAPMARVPRLINEAIIGLAI